MSPFSKIIITLTLLLLNSQAFSTLIEAENSITGGSEKKADSNASNGYYSFNTQGWQPLFSCKVPEGDKKLTIWVRYRGVDICVKTEENKKQKELNWVWGKKNDWIWKKAGTYNRNQLGSKIIIIRHPKGTENCGLDAVYITEDSSWNPNKKEQVKTNATPGGATEERAVVKSKNEQKSENLPTTPLSLKINWNKSTGKTDRKIFSLAIFQGFNPDKVAHPLYAANMKYINMGLARYHNTSMNQDYRKNHIGWMNNDTKTWQKEKIISALKAWNPDNIEKVICISEWPEWMDKDKDRFLDEDEKENFANLCAELVRIINVEAKLNIKYFEITNELDGLYWISMANKNKPIRLQELADIYNLCAEKMKAVDPGIKCGGPAAMRPDLYKYMRTFIKATVKNMDFFSFHGYCSGKLSDSDQKIYNRAQSIVSHARDIKNILKEESPDKHIEAHLNEYNISWTWTTREPRMINHKGAVYDSIMLIELARAGIDAANAWNDMDGIYGKMSSDYKMRPGAHIFHLFNNYMVGDIVKSEIPEDGRVHCMAVNAPNHKAVTIVNRCNERQNISLPVITNARMYQISEKGYITKKISNINKMEFPAHTVTVLVIKK